MNVIRASTIYILAAVQTFDDMVCYPRFDAWLYKARWRHYFGIVSTVLSYQIITGRNVPEAAEVYLLSGGYTVGFTVRCIRYAWVGMVRPTLPEARGPGSPYNWYSPCALLSEKHPEYCMLVSALFSCVSYMHPDKKHQENLRSTR